MPLWQPYRKLLDTDAADMKHTGGRLGGSITAALFLREFAGEQPWAHLDIASVSWQEENSPFAVRGASGLDTYVGAVIGIGSHSEPGLATGAVSSMEASAVSSTTRPSQTRS